MVRLSQIPSTTFPQKKKSRKQSGSRRPGITATECTVDMKNKETYEPEQLGTGSTD